MGLSAGASVTPSQPDMFNLSHLSDSESDSDSMGPHKLSISYGSGSGGNGDGGGSGASTPPPSKRARMESFASSTTAHSTDSSSQEEDGPSKSSPAILNKFFGSDDAGGGMGYSKFAQNMLMKMGHQKGKGLGKHGQGIVDPVAISKQKGRRGLGMQILGLESETVKWDFSQEVVEVEERVSWMPDNFDQPLDTDTLSSWRSEGTKKEAIEDETTFCDPEVLHDVLSCKTIFDRLGEDEMYKARTRCNPFETIRGGFFQNRAAMKMANLDAVFEFMFTSPRDENNAPMVAQEELLFFADVCAGPGGFSEYVLWRKKWESKGYGFTLKGDNDFKLEKFFAGPCESFEPHYGVNGVDGTGDVYDPANLRTFRKFVLDNTDEKGVHFMMADGGFSVEGQENIQEILSKRLYLCQCLMALGIVRPGGHFVCKLFDAFTPFTVGLVYLMYRAFRKVAIHKPNTSRPANSERYLVCKWRREDCDQLYEHLFEVNKRLGELDNTGRTVTELVPLEVLKDDQDFFQYMVNSNDDLGQRQSINLAKIAAFCKDSNLVESRQAEMRKKCLEFWNVPDVARKAPSTSPPAILFDELIGVDDAAMLVDKERELTPDLMKKCFKSCYDWRCMVIGGSRDKRERTFFFGLRRSNVFRWDGAKWEKLQVKLELSPETLVYGELVYELRGVGKPQRRVYTLHIIDAILLGGVDVRAVHLKERHEMCGKFARAMNKPSRPDHVPVKVKDLIRLETVDDIFERLEMQIVKGGKPDEPKLVYAPQVDVQNYICPTGVIFFQMTEEPWTMALSRKLNRKYWFNTKTQHSSYDCPRDSVAGFRSCFRKRVVWWWDVGVQVHDSQEARDGKIHRHDMLEMVRSLQHR